MLEPVQGRVQGTLVDLEHVLGNVLDALRDRPTMERVLPQRHVFGERAERVQPRQHLELGVIDDLEQAGRDLRAGLFARRNRDIHGSPRCGRVAPP